MCLRTNYFLPVFAVVLRAHMDFAKTLGDQSTDAATKFFELANAKVATQLLHPPLESSS